MRYCQDCGIGHECTAPGQESGESDEVKIARINREADVQIAKVNARQDHDWNETRVDIAEIEAEAEVEAAVAEAELLGAAIEGGIEEQPEPVLIDAPEVAEEAPEDAPPEIEGSQPPAPAAKRKVGLGAW